MINFETYLKDNKDSKMTNVLNEYLHDCRNRGVFKITFLINWRLIKDNGDAIYVSKIYLDHNNDMPKIEWIEGDNVHEDFFSNFSSNEKTKVFDYLKFYCK